VTTKGRRKIEEEKRETDAVKSEKIETFFFCFVSALICSLLSSDIPLPIEWWHFCIPSLGGVPILFQMRCSRKAEKR